MMPCTHHLSPGHVYLEFRFERRGGEILVHLARWLQPAKSVFGSDSQDAENPPKHRGMALSIQCRGAKGRMMVILSETPELCPMSFLVDMFFSISAMFSKFHLIVDMKSMNSNWEFETRSWKDV